MANHSDAILEIGKIVTRLTGVQLGEKNRSMIVGRLSGRMSELGLATHEDYLKYIQSNSATELPILIGSLTTHHTYFFREISHFEYLTATALPELVRQARARDDKTIRVLSAACSRGQEVYSLAMWISGYLEANAPDVQLALLGTDVDPESVEIAKNGVYFWKEVKEIPMQFLNKFWARGTGEISEFARVKPALRKMCDFQVGNLLNITLPSSSFDIVFCRNVFIYFSEEEVRRTSLSLINLLRQGYFFIGVSESLNALNLPLERKGPSIYTKQSQTATAPAPTPAAAAAAARGAAQPAPKLTLVPPPAAPIRVLCVDDSPVILSLLKKILIPEFGFEVVATAANGEEALTVAKAHRFDVMTLDVHMPIRTGIGYLEAVKGQNHPPVMMLTSVAREDKDLAEKALSLGAKDFVEKPSLSNLQVRAEEIRTKVRMLARHASQDRAAGATRLDPKFQVAMDHAVAGSWRALLADGADKAQVEEILSQSRFPSLSTVIVWTKPPSAPLDRAMVAKYNVSVMTWTEFESRVKAASSFPFAVMAVGNPQSLRLDFMKLIKKPVLLINEAFRSQTLQGPVLDAVPYSSFSYIADNLVCKKAA